MRPFAGRKEAQTPDPISLAILPIVRVGGPDTGPHAVDANTVAVHRRCRHASGRGAEPLSRRP